MDKQEPSSLPVGHKPSSYDIPSMIVIYTLVLILGVGLCFCLRKANRLVPNRYSFPLILRSGDGNRRRTQQNEFADINDEESRQGLLNDFDDTDEEDLPVNTHRHHEPIDTSINTNALEDMDDDMEGDEFGDLQGADDEGESTEARIAQDAAKKRA